MVGENRAKEIERERRKQSKCWQLTSPIFVSIQLEAFSEG